MQLDLELRVLAFGLTLALVLFAGPPAARLLWPILRPALVWIARTEVFRWFVQSLIALDCLCNAFVLPIFTWSVGMSGESMSAHCYRDSVKGRFWAVRLMPLIDWLFSKQKPDPAIKNARGEVITGHCERAFHKEKMGYYLPPEYKL